MVATGWYCLYILNKLPILSTKNKLASKITLKFSGSNTEETNKIKTAPGIVLKDLLSLCTVMYLLMIIACITNNNILTVVWRNGLEDNMLPNAGNNGVSILVSVGSK